MNGNQINKLIWIGLASLFLVTQILPVSNENLWLIGAVVSLQMLMAVFINPLYWFLSLASLANVWFIWAWILGWYHISGSSQRFVWRAVVVSGLVFNCFAILAVALSANSMNFTPWIWLSCLLAMQLMILVIAYDAKRQFKHQVP